MMDVLISHAHAERPLAEAWKQLLETASMGMINVWYSSDTSPEGGMQIGEQWRDTLRQRIEQSTFVLAILSPTSRDRPWILWECGVANGLTRAKVQAGDGRATGAIIPVIYSMSASELENPLSSFQVYSGENRERISEICARLAKEAGIPNPQQTLWGPLLDEYVQRVKAHQPRKAKTMDDMLLWRGRVEQLIQGGRPAEVHGLRQQMYAAFGKSFKPISMQLHDLLSKVMLETKHFPEAIEEANYGLQIDGSDTALLHRKALALVEQQNYRDALATVNSVKDRQPELATNTEIAGLEGRIYRDRYRLSGDEADRKAAQEAYGRAAKANPADYYCAINAAEMALIGGDKTGAEGFLDQALKNARVAQEARRSSFWADFTLGQILLGKGDTEGALAEYGRGLQRDPAPSKRDRESARKGALRTAEVAGAPAELKAKLGQMLA